MRPDVNWFGNKKRMRNSEVIVWRWGVEVPLIYYFDDRYVDLCLSLKSEKSLGNSTNVVKNDNMI